MEIMALNFIVLLMDISLLRSTVKIFFSFLLFSFTNIRIIYDPSMINCIPSPYEIRKIRKKINVFQISFSP